MAWVASAKEAAWAEVWAKDESGVRKQNARRGNQALNTEERRLVSAGDDGNLPDTMKSLHLPIRSTDWNKKRPERIRPCGLQVQSQRASSELVTKHQLDLPGSVNHTM